MMHTRGIWYTYYTAFVSETNNVKVNYLNYYVCLLNGILLYIMQLIHDNTHRDGSVDNHRNVGQPGGHKQWHVGMDMAYVEHKDWHNYQMMAEETQRTGNS